MYCHRKSKNDMRSSLPILQVFNAWGKKKGVDSKLYRFLNPDGGRIKPEQTPAEVNISTLSHSQ